MAYFIEFSTTHGEGLYAEFELLNRSNGAPILSDGIDWQFSIRREFDDYCSWHHGGQVIASTTNGLISEPVPGILALNIPPDALQGQTYDSFGWYDFGGGRRNTLHCGMVGVPLDPSFAKVLFKGTISFGDRVMSCPRVKLYGYPLIPNSPTAGTIAAVVKPGAVLRSAYLTASETVLPGSVLKLATSIPADPRNPIAMAWADPAVAPGDALDAFNQSLNALSALQDAQIFALAGSPQAVLPPSGPFGPLPTSSVGLVSGQYWNNGGVVMVVP